MARREMAAGFSVVAFICALAPCLHYLSFGTALGHTFWRILQVPATEENEYAVAIAVQFAELVAFLLLCVWFFVFSTRRDTSAALPTRNPDCPK